MPNLRGKKVTFEAQPVRQEESLTATSRYYNGAQVVEESYNSRDCEAHSMSQERSQSEEPESRIKAPPTKWESQRMGQAL